MPFDLFKDIQVLEPATLPPKLEKEPKSCGAVIQNKGGFKLNLYPTMPMLEVKSEEQQSLAYNLVVE